MMHIRYWAMTLATAVCGAFIAVERFAFARGPAVWIAFGVAIAATVLSAAAFLVALLRENHAFSAMSGLSVLAGVWTIIAQRTFAAPTALWLAFAGGLVLVLLALRGLALHETTIERVVYSLAPAGDQTAGVHSPAGGRSGEVPETAGEAAAGSSVRRGFAISAAMRSWMYWLTHTGLALAGAFVVLLTFALTAPGHHHASVRWIAFGIGIAATAVALASLLERAFAREFAGLREGLSGRLGAIALTATSMAVGVAMIVTMSVLSGSHARWVAFGLGCGIAGVSLVALIVHELTSERVRHELEITAPAAQPSRTTSTA
jgi:hypothetical protein